MRGRPGALALWLVVAVVIGSATWLVIDRSAGAAPDVIRGVGLGAIELLTERGQPMDVSVEITNDSSSAVEFEKIPSLITIPGLRNGRLVDAAFYETLDVALATEGWPPRRLGESTWGFATSAYPTRPFDGYVLQPHQDAYLVYAIVGDGSLGTFAAGGVVVQYRIGSDEGSSRIFGGAVDCVQVKPQQCSGPGTVTSDEVLTKMDALR